MIHFRVRSVPHVFGLRIQRCIVSTLNPQGEQRAKLPAYATFVICGRPWLQIITHPSNPTTPT